MDSWGYSVDTSGCSGLIFGDMVKYILDDVCGYLGI